MKTGILYATMDLFHYGHLEAINFCKRQCDRLIVAISTDEFNAEKGKKSMIPYWQRVEIVRNIKGVDEVIPEHCWGQKSSDIDKYNLDYIFVDKEWVGKIRYDLGFKSTDITIVPVPRTPGISSTQLKERLKNGNEIL